MKLLETKQEIYFDKFMNEQVPKLEYHLQLILTQIKDLLKSLETNNKLHSHCRK